MFDYVALNVRQCVVFWACMDRIGSLVAAAVVVFFFCWPSRRYSPRTSKIDNEVTRQQNEWVLCKVASCFVHIHNIGNSLWRRSTMRRTYRRKTDDRDTHRVPKYMQHHMKWAPKMCEFYLLEVCGECHQISTCWACRWDETIVQTTQ